MRIGIGLVLGLLLALSGAGCGGDSGDGVASATSSAAPDELTGEERALQFARCMREHGIDVADPQAPRMGSETEQSPARAVIHASGRRSTVSTWAGRRELPDIRR